jgi:PhnB protein
MKLHPHINFGGRCEDAFHFYAATIGTTLGTMLTWGDSPMSPQVPAEWHGKICHASMSVGDCELAGVDDPFEQYEPPKGFQLVLEVDEPDEAERIFSTLAQNGRVILAMQSTFWSGIYGIVLDQFGLRWEIQATVRHSE